MRQVRVTLSHADIGFLEKINPKLSVAIAIVIDRLKNAEKQLDKDDLHFTRLQGILERLEGAILEQKVFLGQKGLGDTKNAEFDPFDDELNDILVGID